MSYRNTLVRAGLVAVVLFLGNAALRACGPYFPRWLVTDESRILEAPTTWLKDALASQPSPFDWNRPQQKLKAVVPPEQGPHRQTAEVDQRDLETVTSNRTLTAQYAEVRERLAQYGDAVEAWRQEAAWSDPPPPRPEPPADLTVPMGLPGEFEDYLRGAIAYHQGRYQAAQSYWKRLLDRPEAQRRLRSTWAAYMLGRLALQNDSNTGAPTDPEGAIQWFKHTRELAGQGFPDPLGLATASLGWQARAELALKRPDEALVLYLSQVQAGDPRAVQSIRTTSFKLLNEPQSLKQIAGSDDARPIMTAYVLSRWDRVDYDGLLDPAPARKWLEAIKAVQPKNFGEADRLAWVSYRAGDFAAAEEWLKRASGPMANWLQAKLLMRAGKLQEAESALAQIGGRLPMNLGPEHDAWEAYENQVDPAIVPHSEGDRGAVKLARGDYKGALDALLFGGYWSDASYIAERVMTTNEMITYVAQSWPVKLASHRPEEYGDGWSLPLTGTMTPDKERIAYDLRYLAGRRLVREGRYEEAEKFLPVPLSGSLKLLTRSLAEGRDEKRPAAERSRSLFRAACVTRYQGLELLGTELDPDWFVYEAQYENDSFAKARTGREFKRLGPTEDEKKRAKESAANPNKRFHYRYRGMALAKEAADLLPDGTVEKARILATAGNWVEGRDPEAAKPFLDAILSCCGGTDVTTRARKVNAIPNVPDACEAETRGREEAQ